MATTTIVKVKIEELSKYGFKANGKYVGLSKQLPEADKTKIVPGAEFEAEYYVADSGKEYLNKIVKTLTNATTETPVNTPTAITTKVDTERAKKFLPKFVKKDVISDSEKMSKADWSAKDRSQLIGGLSHDAATLAAVVININSLDAESALSIYKVFLEGMLKIREEVK